MWVVAFFTVAIGTITGVQYLMYIGRKTAIHRHYTNLCQPPAIDPTDIVLAGEDIEFTREEMHSMLVKRFSYYNHLNTEEKQRFLTRMQDFMFRKIFIIKDDEGFKDMPVLVAAAAVQLCFGLKEYQLPFYRYIRIYPEEYFAEHEFLKVLKGNVHNNVISIAWNHLLHGYLVTDDGANVGVHEMSHALYMQKMVIEEGFAPEFFRLYNLVKAECCNALEEEMRGDKKLFSDYAKINLQEFWAESVELFFEKPLALKENHPALFNTIKILLNQDPLNRQSPVMPKPLSAAQRLRRIRRLFTEINKSEKA